MSTPRAAAPAATRVDALQRLRDSYAQSITTHTDALVQRLGSLIKAAHVSEEPENARERLQIDACSADIIRSAQALLRVVSELKHQVLLNDFAGIEEDAAATEVSYAEHEQQLRQRLDALRREHADAMAALQGTEGGRE